eukprot:CAMPEP_0194499684 /NCGR_PEP_ID=MMETSP0253-20130528/15911_1 /TAXON_ID=2966 /ORGANISM="Noctiluca scintillans" /LENGTH=708 /DNA_ID=CAMNT_0039341455 /DNA_START=36 /DNA_END=2162 /DNA_ORIENTATION=+
MASKNTGKDVIHFSGDTLRCEVSDADFPKERSNTKGHNASCVLPTWAYDWRTLSSVCVACSIVALALWRLMLNEADKQAQFRAEVETVAQWYRTTLVGQVETSLSSVHALSALLKVDNLNMTVNNFASIADMLIGRLEGITNLQLAPFATIRYIHPLEGSESAIGLPLLLDPYRVDGTLGTIAAPSVVLYGPTELFQGGLGFFASLAIFTPFAPEFLPDESWTNNGETYTRVCSDPAARSEHCQFAGPVEEGQETYFWGLAIMMTTLEDLMSTLSFEDLEKGAFMETRFHWQLRDVSSDARIGVFAESVGEQSCQDPVLMDVSISDIGLVWELTLCPAEGWPTVSSEFWIQICLLVAVAGLMVAVAVGFMFIGTVRSAHRRVERLQRLRSQKQMAVVKSCVADVDRARFPMCVMSLEHFFQLGKLITHESARNQGKLEFLDTVEMMRASAPCTLFVSHQWTGFASADPSNTQYLSVVDACVMLANDGLNIRWVWVDYFSIPQANADQQQAAVDSLAVYAAHCAAFVAVVPTCKHAETGSTLDANTYFSRAWCRLEQLAYLAGAGHDGDVTSFQMVDEVLLPLMGDTKEHNSLEVFAGEFTCCARGHPGKAPCDRERIVSVMLGILWRCKFSNHQRSSHLSVILESIEKSVDKHFPSVYEYSWKDAERVCVESRELFGDLVSVLQVLFNETVSKDKDPDVASDVMLSAF